MVRVLCGSLGEEKGLGIECRFCKGGAQGSGDDWAANDIWEELQMRVPEHAVAVWVA